MPLRDRLLRGLPVVLSLGLFLLALVMVGRDRFFKPWTWFKK